MATEEFTSHRKYRVCPECDGEGYSGTLGAYSFDELYEEFENADEYLEANEASKVPCEMCRGLRVVTAPQVEAFEEERAYRAEMAAESRYMGY